MTQTSQSGTIGAGQQTPFDGNSDSSVTMFIAKQLIAQLEIMIPVQVHTVHAGSGSPPTAGTVDVQLLVSLLDGSGNQVKQGIVYGVPYFRAQGGPWAIICDPAANDVGFLLSASRDISKLSNGVSQQVIPGSNRQLSYSDGIYIGGVFNSNPTATIWLKSDGTFAITDKTGNSIVSSSLGMTLSDVNSNKIQMQPGSVNVVTTSFNVNGVPVTVP
jgi:hypothetical protein